MKVIRIATAAAILLGSFAVGVQPTEAATHWKQANHFNYGGFNNHAAVYNRGYNNGINGAYVASRPAYSNMATCPVNSYSLQNNNNFNVNSRQSSINAQIQRGIASGRLTPSEANKLMRAQQKIDQLEANLRLSGNGLNVAERQRLNIELNKLTIRTQQDLFDRQVR